mmetsp:Transcript_4472/g.12927  ORF Transcript_4472/g.12927 Transcript_4472/m.12927 type:complete len:149 (+) Transcript_4472:50-496(+)
MQAASAHQESSLLYLESEATNRAQCCVPRCELCGKRRIFWGHRTRCLKRVLAQKGIGGKSCVSGDYRVASQASTSASTSELAGVLREEREAAPTASLLPYRLDSYAEEDVIIDLTTMPPPATPLGMLGRVLCQAVADQNDAYRRAGRR